MQLLTPILLIALALYTATGAAAASRGRPHPMLPAGITPGTRATVLLTVSALLYTVAAAVVYNGHVGPGLGVALAGLAAWAVASRGIGADGVKPNAAGDRKPRRR